MGREVDAGAIKELARGLTSVSDKVLNPKP